MGAISEILSGVKTVVEYKVVLENIKSELNDEIIINLSFLEEVVTGENIDTQRLKKIMTNISIEELRSYLTCSYPKSLISNKKVTKKIIGNIPANQLLISKKDIDLEEICRRIKRMTIIIQKDFDGVSDPKARLLNIKYYLKVARKLL